MERKHMEEQLRYAMSALGNAAIMDDEAVTFIYLAVKEKLDKQERAETPVGRQDYLDALADRAKRMEDKGLGHFVKSTLWTATDHFKKGDGK